MFVFACVCLILSWSVLGQAGAISLVHTSCSARNGIYTSVCASAIHTRHWARNHEMACTSVCACLIYTSCYTRNGRWSVSIIHTCAAWNGLCVFVEKWGGGGGGGGQMFCIFHLHQLCQEWHLPLFFFCQSQQLFCQKWHTLLWVCFLLCVRKGRYSV